MLELPQGPLLATLLVSVLLFGAGPRTQPGPPASIRIFEIQGTAHVSPLAGQLVQAVPGVVTAVRNNGFTLQDADGDGRPETSDAIFVFTRSAPSVVPGDSVRVSGRVREFRPASDENNLSITEIDGPTVTVVAQGQPLPPPVVLGEGGRTVPQRVVADGISGDVELASSFTPDQSALDFFESLEAMRVQLADAVAVGPRAGPGELPVLPAMPEDRAGASRQTVRGGLLAAPPGEASPGIVLVDGAIRTPPASVGDRFPGLTTGVVDYAFGGYRVRVETLPALVLGGIEPEQAAFVSSPDTLSLATFNVENVSPRERPAKLARLAETVVARLGSPDALMLQEIQDDSGAADDGVVSGIRTARALTDAIHAAGGPTYEYREIAPENNQDGGEPGGNIRVGLLFRADGGLAFVERPGGGATTAVGPVTGTDGVQLSVSPGRLAPGSPAWMESRKPLVAEVTFNGRRIILIGCHFASKRGSQPRYGRFQPPASPTDAHRQQQAREVRAFVEQVLARDPTANIVVLGDLNDTPGSATLAELTSGPLTNLVAQLPEADQYSYVFGGQSEAIDHILVSPQLLGALVETDIVHGNAEIVGGPSDHDPVLARFSLPPR